jgi:FkbM family methyltransferase
MLLDLKSLIQKYDLNITGVIHIGAHYGQEHEIYLNNKIERIMYFEPLKKNFEVLKKNYPNHKEMYNIALGNFNGEIEMYVESANSGMSSSILLPKKHLDQYPHIIFNDKEIVEIKRFDDLVLDKDGYNLIMIDVQGYELEVFKGSAEFLENVDYIISEINRDEVYENCAKIQDLLSFLSPYGFELVEQNWAGDTWGDGFFIKKKNKL